MKKGIIGKKIGMTQIFDEKGNVIPVTVIEAGPCYVAQKKTVETDGYEALQLAFQDATRKYIEAGKDLEGKGFDPRKLLAPGCEGIKRVVREKMELFGSLGKAE